MKRQLVSAGSVIAKKEGGRRAAAGARFLEVALIKREERRRTHQREEDRYRGVVTEAVLHFGIRKAAVRVENISSSGAMLSLPGELKIGQRVRLQFEGFDPLPATVRWIAGAHAGIEVPQGSIELFEDPEEPAPAP